MTSAQELVNTRSLTLYDVLRIMSQRPRVGADTQAPLAFTARFKFLTTQRLKTAPTLAPGHGYLLVDNSHGGRHAVVLWRGTDGEYHYFDSNRWCPSTVVSDYVSAGGARHLYQNRCRLQGLGVGSCAYHAFTFMDYVTKNDDIPTCDMWESYHLFYGEDCDVQVVEYVEDHVLAHMRPRIMIRGDRNSWGKRRRELLLVKDQEAPPAKRRR